MSEEKMAPETMENGIDSIDLDKELAMLTAEDFDDGPETEEVKPEAVKVKAVRAAEAPKPAANSILHVLTEEEEQEAALRQKRFEKVQDRLSEARLDENGNPILDNDRFDPLLLRLHQMRTGREVVVGFISGVKQGPNGYDYVTVLCEGFDAVIPCEKMGLRPVPVQGETESHHRARIRTILTTMIGAHIKFCITHVDEESRVVAGDREMASKILRRKILDSTDHNGNYTIRPGKKIKGSVLATHESYALVDVYGMITRLFKNSIKSDFVTRVNDEIEPGDIIDLTVVKTERDANGSLKHIEITMRNDVMEKDTMIRAADSLQRGDILTASVVSRSQRAIFMRLTSGLTAFAYVSNGIYGRKIPSIGDRVAFEVIEVKSNSRSGNPIVKGRIIRSINRYM